MSNDAAESATEQRRPAVWKKKGELSARVRHRRAVSRLRRLEAAERGEVRIKPIQAHFLGALARNGGNVAAAARSVDVSVSTARGWMRKAWAQAAYEAILEEIKGEVREWAEHLGRAQGTLLDLLDSQDDRVRKDVAMYLVNRAQGMPSQKVDQTVTHQSSLNEIEMQAALSLVQGRGLTLSQATRYVREHPDEVKAWAQAQITQEPERQRLEAGEQVEEQGGGSAGYALPQGVSDGGVTS